MAKSDEITVNLSADTGAALAVAYMMAPLVALRLVSAERATAAVMRFVKVRATLAEK